MADDRIDGDELPLTHEFLSFMLGVQRPGVTLAVQALEREGLIDARRARIIITDRRALEKKSNGTYTPQRDKCRRVISDRLSHRSTNRRRLHCLGLGTD